MTELLVSWNTGDEEALGKLLPLVYDELRNLARRHLRRERPDPILQTTALVHEAYLRLSEKKEIPWRNRTHFYAVAARVMRRLLVDSARQRDAAKRRGMKVSVDEALPGKAPDLIDVISLDEALTELRTMNEKQARVVELRYFGGLSIEEVAEMLEISVSTVKRDWSVAKAWLHHQLSAERTR